MTTSIDLHTHSSCSDGTLPPDQLVAAAANAGLTAVALTDHDTVAGIPAALAAGATHAIEVVGGVEISAFLDRLPVHILGLWVDPEDDLLQQALTRIQELRRRRNRSIIHRLAALGIQVDDDELAALAGDQVGRPHFARVLAARRLVPDVETAFRRYLGKNGRAYVAKEPFAAHQAISAIRHAGGVAVLAHPHLLPVATRLEAVVAQLAAAGLGGLEVYYPGMAPHQSQRLAGLAKRFGLAESGGSDYHGDDSHHPLAGTSAFRVPPACLESLRRHRAP